MFTVKTSSGSYMECTTTPNECPYCHKTITPLEIAGNMGRYSSQVIFLCPNDQCRLLFFGYYKMDMDGRYNFVYRTNIGTPVAVEFSADIKGVSPGFTVIYNQAKEAEDMSLAEICGVGYRKALEFLIKDYAILRYPEKKEIIEKSLLAKCIGDYVDDSRIKLVAERAVWLGNDETHYIKKWEGKNLEDLKLLIKLTVHWIEMEMLTQSYNNSMPKT